MVDQKWSLKGIFYECCRTNGHCPLWFGRDLTDGPCCNLATYQVKEGQIQGVNMAGIVFTYACDGIGPKSADLGPGKQGIDEGAIYISDTATDEQRKVLEPFLASHFSAMRWKKCLGVEFVKLSISEDNGTYTIAMPDGEQKMALTKGADGQGPERMENPRNGALSNVKFCNTEYWKYNGYGKNMHYHQTSGAIADFYYKGDS